MEIKKIKVTEDTGDTISEGFSLELADFTIITGENNSGKTNFIRAVDDKSKVSFLNGSEEQINSDKIEIVYIEADNVKPSDDELKESSQSSSLIENLADLFSTLEFEFKLNNQAKINTYIEEINKKTNSNISDFTGDSNHEHKIEIDTEEENLDSKVIIKSLIKNITASEDGEERDLDKLGQGTQRMLIASILKAYLDIKLEKEISSEKSVLILFEEPEVYLHPDFKRSLNSTLEEISKLENHQVIITTHDSYFIFLNFQDGEEKKKIYSFYKNDDNETKISIEGLVEGIEDELLHIILFDKVLGNKTLEEFDKELQNDSDIETKEYYLGKYGPSKNFKKTRSLPLLIRHQIHHPNNPYTRYGVNHYTSDELKESIEILNNFL